MGSVSFLIKPASGRCNLACRYCFYRDVAENRTTEDFGLMSEDTSAALIERAFEFDADVISFGFQGGEPTLAGLRFFERFAERVRSRAQAVPSGRPGGTIRPQFSLQTNGVNLNAEWARFFKREGFLVGVSIDGPRLLHDAFRVRRDDSPTYADAMAGASRLLAEGVPTNALCVVDAATADNAERVYRHLRSRGFDWIQFIPCLDPLGEESGGHSWSLTPDAYGRFLKTIFDLRYEEWRAGAGVNVRWHDNIVRMAAGLPSDQCGMSGSCEVGFTIEADGSVYPCDFYVTDEWRLGDLRSASFSDMRSGEVARRFIESSRFVDPACVSCFAFPLCRGGCRRDREPFAAGTPSLNRYCTAFADFFRYAGARIMEMAEAERRVSEEAATRSRGATGASPT